MGCATAADSSPAGRRPTTTVPPAWWRGWPRETRCGAPPSTAVRRRARCRAPGRLSVRSLSFARVPGVSPCRHAKIVGVRLPSRSQMHTRRGHMTRHAPARRADVLWSSCDCSDRWWITRFGGGHCWRRCTRGAPASRRSATRIPYLLRAAKYHGKPSSVMCPICRKEQLTLVSWVFGDHWARCPGRRGPPRNWCCWQPASTNSRYMWWRYAAPAVGITW